MRARCLGWKVEVMALLPPMGGCHPEPMAIALKKYKNSVIPAQAGTHSSMALMIHNYKGIKSAQKYNECRGWMGSRLRGNDTILIFRASN